MPAVPPAIIPQTTPTAASMPADAGRGPDQAGGSTFQERLQGAVARQGSPPAPTSPGVTAPATLSTATTVAAAAPPPAPQPADPAGPVDGEPAPPSAGAQVQPAHAQPDPGVATNVALSPPVSTKASLASEQAGSTRRAGPATQAFSASQPQTQAPQASSGPVALEPAPPPLPPEPDGSRAAVSLPEARSKTESPIASPGQDTKDVRTPPRTPLEADPGAVPIPAAVPTSPETRAPVVATTTESLASPAAATLAPVAMPPAPELAPPAHITQAMAPAELPERAAPASPVAQIAAPLVALGTAPDGAQRLTVRLDPEALGSVQIHVDRPKDGPARVAITVERPETLTLLLRDGTQLQQALDHAGIPPEGHSLTLHVADSAPRAETSPSGNGVNPGSARAGEGDGGGGTRRERSGSGGEPLPDRRPRTLRWSRAGLDITA